MSAFLFTLPSGDTGAPAEKLPKASAHAQASPKRFQQCVHTCMLSPLLKTPPHLQNNLSRPGARRLWAERLHATSSHKAAPGGVPHW